MGYPPFIKRDRNFTCVVNNDHKHYNFCLAISIFSGAEPPMPAQASLYGRRCVTSVTRRMGTTGDILGNQPNVGGKFHWSSGISQIVVYSLVACLFQSVPPRVVASLMTMNARTARFRRDHARCSYRRRRMRSCMPSRRASYSSRIAHDEIDGHGRSRFQVTTCRQKFSVTLLAFRTGCRNCHRSH